MHRDPATHPDSDGSNLAILNPNACLPFAIPGFDAEAVHQMDHRVLQTSQLGMQIASASAASAWGLSVKPRSARTINPTWVFCAAPVPTMACLTRFGAYSKMFNPRWAAANMADPRAAPKVTAVLEFCTKITLSTAQTFG